MKKLLTVISSICIVAAGAATTLAASGQELFNRHCVACHKDGGNIVNPKRTLKKTDLAQNGIKDSQGFVKYLRNPGAAMTRFDQKALPDKDAKAIAEYVLKTFK